MAFSIEDSRSVQLRNWYLARLRKRAFNEANNLTPLSLIEKDRQFIETLISGSTNTVAEEPVRKSKKPFPRWIGLWLAGTIAFFVIVVCLSGNVAGGALVAFKVSPGLLSFSALESVRESAPWWLWLLPIWFYVVPVVGSVKQCLSYCGEATTITARTLLLGLGILTVPVVLALLSLLDHGTVTAEGGKLAAGILAWQSVAAVVFCQYVAHRILNDLGLVEAQAVNGTASGDRVSANISVHDHGLAGLASVIAELRRRNQELESREQLIADVADEIVCTIDAELRVAGINSTFSNSLGFAQGELVGRKLSELILSEDFDRVGIVLQRGRTEKEPQLFDCRVLTRYGKALDLAWTVEWSETETCYFACARDITDQKKLERAKREFVAMIGHDIKTPVSSALLGMQSLSEGASGQLSQESASVLLRIESSLRRLIGLINELLEYEKANAGVLDLELEEVNLKDVVAAAIEDVADLASRKKLTLNWQLVSDVYVLADAPKLGRVMVNLVSNAIKFSPPGSTVQINATENKKFVELNIIDQGPGIAAEYQQLVFERYERLTGEGSAIEGTGLGLAIARAIVQSHGGTIGVKSRENEGATFWITLPALPDVYEV